MDFLDEKALKETLDVMVVAFVMGVLLLKVADECGLIDKEASDCEEES